MIIKAVPIREAIADKSGLIGSIWHNFLDSIVIRLNTGNGVTGTFTTTDGKTVTVTNGIITGIV